MTYSIVARDPDTGEFGVAVQSHFFTVGPIVPWLQAGVGAVATQSFVEPAYGLRGLARMAAGEAAPDALAALVADDEARDVRQVAMVDTAGRVGAHTGAKCIMEAGHRTGDGFSVQANLMRSGSVPDAMFEAYASSPAPLAERLLEALVAAEEEGGDIRGRQSAAIRIVRAQSGDDPWHDVVLDLRVDDHPDPLAELDRLLDLADAYALATEGDELVGQGRHDEAGERYRSASALAPGNHELLFWAGMAAAQAGDLPTAVDRVREAIRLQPGWRELLGRLDSEIAPGAPAVLEALEDAGEA